MADWGLGLLQMAAGKTVGRAVAAAVAAAAGTPAAVETAAAVDKAAVAGRTASAADSRLHHTEGFPGEAVDHIDL